MKTSHFTMISDSNAKPLLTFFQEICNHSSQGILITSLEGSVLYANQTVCTETGINYQRILNRNIFDLVHKNQFADVQTIISELKTGNSRSADLETQINLFKTDSWVCATIRIQEFDDTRLLVITLNNISELRSIRIKYQETQRLIKSFNENLVEALYSSTPNGEIIFTNKVFDQLFGFGSDESINNEIQIFAHPQQLRLLKNKMHGLEYIKNERILFRKKDGKTFWGLVNSTLNINNLQEYVYNFSISDINEEVAAKLKYNQVLEQANSSIIICNENYDIQYFNHASERLFGTPRDCVINRPLAQFLPETIIDRLQKIYNSQSKAESEMFKGSFDHELSKINGQAFWGNINMNAISIGSEVQYILFITDSTERINYNQLIQEKNAELEKTNHQLDSFLYSAYHDLRAPLTTMLGLINLMKMEKEQGQVGAYVGMVEKTVRKLDYVLLDMISFTKNTKQFIKSNLIDVPALLKECAQLIGSQYDLNQFEITINANLSQAVYSDEDRLKSILTHLIKNAVQYADLGKNPPKITINAQSIDNRFIVTVEDNGVGISKTHHAKVFEMFYRGSEASVGSGLGLYLVKETVQKLMGSIQLESEPGEFTRFTVQIPNSIKAQLISKKMELKKAS